MSWEAGVGEGSGAKGPSSGLASLVCPDALDSSISTQLAIPDLALIFPSCKIISIMVKTHTISEDLKVYQLLHRIALVAGK